MPAHAEVPAGWSHLLKRTISETGKNDGLGMAAQLAYYFFLALFPALIVLIALAGVIASGDLVNQIVGRLQGVTPPAVIQILRDQLVQLSSGTHGGILTFGVAAAVWSSSSAMVALINALNRAYDVDEGRAWWRQRLTAILLTVGAAVFILVSIVLVIAGPQLADTITRRVGLGAAFDWTWKIVQWPIVFLLVVTAVGLIYRFAPDVEQGWVWLTPGSVLATVLWLIGSLGFRYYVVNFGSYNKTYGAIGGIMVLMSWLYISGLAIIIGAELNAEIEHASSHDAVAGRHAPGHEAGRKVIGPRTARAPVVSLPGDGPAPAARTDGAGDREPVPPRDAEPRRRIDVQAIARTILPMAVVTAAAWIWSRSSARS